MNESVVVTKSISGKWWRMSYQGKVEFTEDEPTEKQKSLFKESAERAIRMPGFSGNGRSLTISDAESKRVVEVLK